MLGCWEACGSIFEWILGWFGGPEDSKNQIQVKMNFEGLLDRSWVDFGPKLGGKLGPSWHQNLKNGGPKTMSKKVKQKGHASQRRVTQVRGGWVPINHQSRASRGQSVGHRTLHIVPQGHGGGYMSMYVYVSICIYVCIHIYI